MLRKVEPTIGNDTIIVVSVHCLVLLFLSRFMNTPERLSALRVAKQTLRIRDQKITRMKKRLESITLVKGIQVDSLDSDVSEEIEKVVEDRSLEMNTLPKSDFRRIFWDQQVV